MSQKPLIVIVGAGPGVSAGVAKKFGANGFRVVNVSRTKESLDTFSKELNLQEIEAYGVEADAADPDSLRKAFEHIKSEYGVPEVLVYNAAKIAQGTSASLTDEQLLNDFKVNVAGALVSAQQVIPELIERKEGTLLFTGGGFALYPSSAYTSLSIGKAGVRALAFTLADELSPHGIYVGTVTIAGLVKPGTYYDPDRIADVYWDLYVNKNQTEVFYKEA
ncbi:SDR family NAD(P)-dependent oxidoreductase [Paenibacillus sp. SI8]|uniref:SDR family NAD(P)-dependent oxidoreductase n=1 Tax=unclassified Paenibacillus TaxID=185978 RepID=UPI0034669F6F